MRLVLAFVLASAAAACAPAEPDEFACDETCDSDGPLQLSDTWVPDGGFVRATVTGQHELLVRPSAGTAIEPRDGGRYIVRFDGPGYYQVTAGSGSIGVRVSDEGPRIELDPIGDDGFAKVGKVRVTGTVVDPLGTESLTLMLGEVKVQYFVDSKFDFTIATEFGLETLDFRIIDAAGNEFQEPYSFIAADDYGTITPETVLSISQSGIDILAEELSAGLGYLLTKEGPTDPVYESFLADVYIDSFEFPSASDLSITLAEGGLDAKLTVPGQIVVRGRIESGVTSTFAAELSNLHVGARLSASVVDGEPVISVANVSVSSDEPDISVSGIIPDALFAWLVGNVDDHIAKAVNEELPAALDKVIASAAGSFGVSVPGQGRELPGRYDLEDIRIHDGQAEVRLDTSVEVPAGAGPGAPIANYEEISLPASQDGIVLERNFLNQYLFALWRAGGFQRSYGNEELDDDLADKVPALAKLDPIIDIRATASQPPVVASSADDRLELGIGNVELVISIDTDFFQIVVSGRIAARAEVFGTVSDFYFHPNAELTELKVDVDQRAFPGLDTERIEALVEAMAPKLVNDWAASLKDVEMPILELDALGTPSRYFGLSDGEGRAADGGVSLVGISAAAE
jgi:hypothetical protein